MTRNKIAAVLLFGVLLAPSAWFAWLNRSMPQLGRAHDDAIYFTVSKSLAEGSGYRIQNLPGAPYETKYPPVLIWLLTVAWLVEPQFPQSLSAAAAIQWAMLPPCLCLALVWLGRAGFSNRWRWAGLALLAVGPYTVSFGAGIYTEVLFTAFLLASLLLCEASQRHQPRWQLAAVAGALAGIAYLTRTAGVVALVAIPAAFLLVKRRREAAAYFASMLPFVAGWMIWAKLHQSPPDDLVTLYNTDYFGFFLEGLRFSDLGVLVWTNLGHLLNAAGSLVFPLETGSLLLQMLRTTVAAGIVHGLYLNRSNRLVQFYSAFAALTVAELLIWNFPPNLRLMYALAPLLAAGLLWEAQHFGRLLRAGLEHRDSTQRAAVRVIAAGALALAGLGIWMQGFMTFRELPEQSAAQAQVRAESEAAFAWIAAHSDSTANVLCLNPALYLYTQRRTAAVLSLPIHWYRSDLDRIVQPIRDLPDGVSAHPMEFLYLHEADYPLMAPGAPEKVGPLVKSNPRLKPVFESGRGVVYRLLSTTATHAR